MITADREQIAVQIAKYSSKWHGGIEQTHLTQSQGTKHTSLEGMMAEMTQVLLFVTSQSPDSPGGPHDPM